MRDNIFLITLCVFFIVLDTLILGYSIGRIYPPIPQQVSTQQTVSSARKEKQEQKSEEQEEIAENIEKGQEQEDLLQEQNIAEQQNLQNEQQAVTITQDENTINTITEPEIPYIYTREEINAMLVIDDEYGNGGSLVLESDYPEEAEIDKYGMPDKIINGETCYIGVASWNEYNDHRVDFYIGNQSLKVYDTNEKYVDIATENFLPALE